MRRRRIQGDGTAGGQCVGIEKASRSAEEIESLELIKRDVARYNAHAVKIKVGGLMFMTKDINAVGPKRILEAKQIAFDEIDDIPHVALEWGLRYIFSFTGWSK